MGKSIRRHARPAVAVALVGLVVGCNHLMTPWAGCGPDGCYGGDCQAHVQVCKNPSVMALAHDLDHLERHIDCYGSVVAKVPDVWGQARLTQYREEFESLMKSQQGAFTVALQGSLSRTDQSYFAYAQTLSLALAAKSPGGAAAAAATTAAAGGQTSTHELLSVNRISPGGDVTLVGPTGTRTNVVGGLTPNTGGIDLLQTGAAAAKPGGGTSGGGSGAGGGGAAAPVNSADDPKNIIYGGGPGTAIQRSGVTTRTVGFGGIAAGGIGLEPTVQLAQRKRYLDFLNQLRRENEGDDTADSPGYSLNLMRVPVSVLPGKKTDVGYGCEITMTLTPILGDDLLPVTYRSLVVNDLIDALGWPLTNLLDQQDVQDGTVLTDDTRQAFRGLDLYDRLHEIVRPGASAAEVAKALESTLGLSVADKARLCAAIRYNDPPACWPVPQKPAAPFDPKAPPPSPLGLPDCKDQADALACDCLITYYIRNILPVFRNLSCPPSVQPTAPTVGASQPSGRGHSTANKMMRMSPFRTADGRSGGRGPGRAQGPAGAKGGDGGRANRRFASPTLPFANGLLARQPIPTSMLADVYGDGNLYEVAYGAYEVFKDEIAVTTYVHLPNIQMYLREELNAAYQFLNANPHLWDFCTHDLAAAVKARQSGILDERRTGFRAAIRDGVVPNPTPGKQNDIRAEPLEYSRTAALAWCIVVESALLADRLAEDMKDLATAKNVPLPLAGQWLRYYDPNPLPEARQAFNEYVKARWPIHVFALDPYTEQQNIADSLSTRRELQLAMSVAFTQGAIGSRQLMQYARRLEAEYETIALNNTQVGFSHGENTFGWRFYPRFQTPDTESNAAVLFRDTLIGGPNRNALLRQRRLEPGMRECVAVVMMPSFVPYLHLDTASNWFPLPNPKHKCLDTAQAMRLSRTVQAIKTCGPGVGDTGCYRDGEFDRLLRRADQLEARLPTQTLTVQVPQLNTLGGFEMFNHGVADLAPELFGFYGAPGISPDKPTTLFLVGDHFSPLHTNVIVGNQAIADKTMLSRQVMQVTVPAGALPVKYDDGTTYARVHVATPYGVSTELEVPILDKPKPPAKSGFTFGSAKLTVNYGMCVTETGKFRPVPQCSGNTDDLKIAWNAPGTVLPPFVRLDLTFEFTPPGGKTACTLRVPCRCPVVGGVNGSEILIPKTALDAMAADLTAQLATFGPFPVDANPLAQGLKSKTATITPLVPPGAFAQGAPTADALAVEFNPTGVCPPPGPCLVPLPVPGLAPTPLCPPPPAPQPVCPACPAVPAPAPMSPFGPRQLPDKPPVPGKPPGPPIPQPGTTASDPAAVARPSPPKVGIPVLPGVVTPLAPPAPVPQPLPLPRMIPGRGIPVMHAPPGGADPAWRAAPVRAGPATDPVAAK